MDGGSSYIIRFPPAGSIWPAGTTPPRCNMPLISPPHKASSWVSSGKGLRLQKHPSLTRALSLVSCSVGSILKFLNLFALNLYFVNEVRWDRGAQWREEETHTVCVSHSSLPQSHRAFSPLSTEPLDPLCWNYSDCQRALGERCDVRVGANRVPQPERAYFLSELEHAF